MHRILGAVAGAVLLAGCGGGGGGGGDGSTAPTAVTPPPAPPPVPNAAPIAHAGASQTVVEGAVVTLNGEASHDSDGSVVDFQWTQTSGTPILLASATEPRATFTAPPVSSDTTLAFQLLITDNDGAVGSSTVTVTVQPETFTLTGTIRSPEGTAVDRDTNDANASRVDNSLPNVAQAVPNPVTVGGYVNIAESGEEGPSFAAGDLSDYYRVTLVAGQTIALFVAAPDEGDPDLYLWNAAGTTIVDGSFGTGGVESLVVPATAEYLVEVHAFDGASNYVLTIGQSQSAQTNGFRLSDDFVPGELIARYRTVEAGGGRAARKLAGWGMQLRSKAGAPSRESLLAVDSGALGISSTQAADAGFVQPDRLAAVPLARDREKLRTLLAGKALRRDPAVTYAHPNYIARSTAVPNDPYYPLQWHYPLINLPAAWDLTDGDAGVTVAVVDTGVLLDHPDLQGQLVPGYDFISNAAVSGDGDGIDADPSDPGDGDSQASSFHGTHVAGTIAAASNNGSLVAGVAPGVRVMPIRVLGQGGGTFYDIVQGVRYAAGLPNDSGEVADPPVDVINLSLGAEAPCGAAEQAILDAVHAAGIVVVVAAGNSSADAAGFSPASCDHVITVSAVGADKSLAPYSNSGAVIDVAAPGGDMSRDVNGDGFPDGILSTHADDSSAAVTFGASFLQGTSMAAPHVAGVVALMKSVSGALTAADVDLLLANGELTSAIGDPGSFGRGLIDAYSAVAAALNAIGNPPTPNPTLGVSPSTLNFGQTATLGTLTVRNTNSGSLQADPPTFAAPWLSVLPLGVDADNLGTYAVVADRTGLAPGTYSDVITVQSNVNTAEVAVIMQVAGSVIEPDAGYLYVLLIDEATGQVAQQVSGPAADGEYGFAFHDVPDGSYTITAGSDYDNDGFICDAGEACGAYLTLFPPQVLEVDGDREALDFSVGHIVAIPAIASQGDMNVDFSINRVAKPFLKEAGP